MEQLNSAGQAGTRSVMSRLLAQGSLGLVLLCISVSAWATSGIANSVAAFCAPSATVPPVSSCSSCHATTNNRGPNDLTAAGTWSLSTATYSNFCPGNTPAPPAPSPAPTPAPTPGMGMGMGTPGSGGIGMGRGGDDDDDDDDGDHDDDDDDEARDDDDDDGASSVSSRIRRLGSRSSGRGRSNRR